jgi:transposase-like protein
MNRRLEGEGSNRRPERCPFCGSKAIGTLAKQVTTATYWRCHECGEMWNVAQLERGKSLR